VSEVRRQARFMSMQLGRPVSWDSWSLDQTKVQDKVKAEAREGESSLLAVSVGKAPFDVNRSHLLLSWPQQRKRRSENLTTITPSRAMNIGARWNFARSIAKNFENSALLHSSSSSLPRN
jgi:hypothetical protein